jgi:hypothetical protein
MRKPVGLWASTTRSQRIHSAHLVSWFIKGHFLNSIGYIASNVRIAVNDKLGKDAEGNDFGLF